MALELTLIMETELPIPFTVADGAGIEKGTLLTMSDPMTAAACTTDNAIIAGVAADNLPATVNVYGRIPVAQNVQDRALAYTQTVTVTVEY